MLTRNRLAFLALIVAIIIVVAVVTAICTGGKAEAPEPGSTATPGATANVCGPNPAPPAANLQPSDFGFRQITAPAPGASVRSPLHMTGQANPFEGAYSITIVGAGANQIASMNYNKSNLTLAFTSDLPFAVSVPTPACAWYHERSGRDGSPVGITQIPVQLLP
jgi:hypothetical protein